MNTLDLPWQEKYRPKSLSDVIGQKAIVEKLASFAKKGNFPSMIFAGNAGVGKTSSALAMANDLYGDDIRRARSKSSTHRIAGASTSYAAR